MLKLVQEIEEFEDDFYELTNQQKLEKILYNLAKVRYYESEIEYLGDKTNEAYIESLKRK